MPYIEPEVILEAKKMDLLTYLQNYDPKELVRISGDTYCTRTHDSLKISNGKWCWFSQGIGGRSALDYLIKVKGMGFTEAVEQLMGRAAIQSPVFFSPQNEKPKEFVLPKPYRYMTQAVSYLTARGINSSIISYCVSTGRLYQTVRFAKQGAYKEYYNIVFVGFDLAQKARYAFVRGINDTGKRFIGDVTGSNKNYSFSVPSDRLNYRLHLFESAIDLLSYATLQHLDGHEWRRENLLSLSGIYQPKKNIEESTLPAALEQFLRDYPHIKKIALHLDNDHAGRIATKTLMTILPKEYEVIDEPPPTGKDYNDHLCNRLGLPRTQTKERSLAR